MDRQTLRDWVHRYSASDLADERGGTGPKLRLSSEQEAKLASLVRSGPDPDEHGVVRWRRVDLAKITQADFA